ncbi:MAG: type II secretion system protein GspG [Azoarcus sp.]|jgi:general secretion pathway protein G|nr:type II secretion system protein GspG [Azoarcus sp.]
MKALAARPPVRRPGLIELLALLLPVAAAIAMSMHLYSSPAGDENAHYTRARNDLRALRSLLLLGPRMPGTHPGLRDLVDRGQLPALPNDPWGRPYQYRNPGREHAYELFSLGPDGVESQDDVIAWNLYGGR